MTRPASPGLLVRQTSKGTSLIKINGALNVGHAWRATRADCCAMNRATGTACTAIRRDGRQKHVINTMHTRDDRERHMNHHAYALQLDTLFAIKKGA